MEETQISKENVERFKEASTFNDRRYQRSYCKQHKASCERFLEFLLAMQGWRSWGMMSIFAKENINNEIIDKQNAIKIYNENGI